MTSAPIKPSTGGSLKGLERLQLETPIYKGSSTSRLEGPALPPNGIPTATSSLERLNERLERLAFGRRPEGYDAPPLETYTTTPAENGDVVRATPEYVRWFLRTYPAAGPGDRVEVPTPRPSSEGYGGATDLTDL